MINRTNHPALKGTPPSKRMGVFELELFQIPKQLQKNKEMDRGLNG
jgi:hypothetical protein